MILSLDLSTKSSGWAIFDREKLIQSGCITSSSTDMIKRIHVSSLEDNLVVMSSAFHINEEYVNKAESNPLVKEVKYVGSALKSCLIRYQ